MDTNTKSIALYPELIEDVLLYLLVAVLVCAIAKIIYDWKEKRRLAREFAEYQERKASEEDN